VTEPRAERARPLCRYVLANRQQSCCHQEAILSHTIAISRQQYTPDPANSPSEEPTITDQARRQRTITQHGLHPTSADGIVSAGG
jgi:hypothetical protein